MDTLPDSISAAEFKARCLALLDQVAETGRTLVVTKRGKPVARILPPEGAEPRSLRGSVLYAEDLLLPTGESWAAEA